MSAKTASSSSSTETKPRGLAALNERERRLLGGMAVVLSLLATFMLYFYAQRSQDTTQREIERLESLLKTLSQKGPEFLAREQAKSAQVDGADRFSPERLTKNDLKLTSFVAQNAEFANIKVDNYDEGQLPLASGKDGGPIITERTLRFDIREAQMSSLLMLLDRIEKSREPVIIKRINLREIPSKKGFVRAEISISTYVQKNKEG